MMQSMPKAVSLLSPLSIWQKHVLSPLSLRKRKRNKKKGRSRGARLTKQKHLAEARRDVELSGPSLDCNAVGAACEATLAIDYVKRARSSSARNQRKKFAKQVEATGGAHAKSNAKKTHDKAVVGEMPIEE